MIAFYLKTSLTEQNKPFSPKTPPLPGHLIKNHPISALPPLNTRLSVSVFFCFCFFWCCCNLPFLLIQHPLDYAYSQAITSTSVLSTQEYPWSRSEHRGCPPPPSFLSVPFSSQLWICFSFSACVHSSSACSWKAFPCAGKFFQNSTYDKRDKGDGIYPGITTRLGYNTHFTCASFHVLSLRFD